MKFKNWGLLFGAVACLAFSSSARAAISSTSAEFFDSTTEGTSSTSKSTKKIFANNESERLKNFVDHNFDRLQEEAARGNGTFLVDYVSLLGCQKSQGVMTEALQKNYQELFNAGKAELIQKTQQLIQRRTDLTHACGLQS